jgi:hypothetical protein
MAHHNGIPATEQQPDMPLPKVLFINAAVALFMLTTLDFWLIPSAFYLLLVWRLWAFVVIIAVDFVVAFGALLCVDWTTSRSGLLRIAAVSFLMAVVAVALMVALVGFILSVVRFDS